ncbi:hypothetical protein KKC91_07545 [bacterium]|nr:hypothetical protein [bacterium]
MYETPAEIAVSIIQVTLIIAPVILFCYLVYSGKWGAFFRLMGKILTPVGIAIAGISMFIFHILRWIGKCFVFLIALIIAAVRKESPPSFNNPSEPKKSSDYYHNDNNDESDDSNEDDDSDDIHSIESILKRHLRKNKGNRDNSDKDDRKNRKIDEYHV